MYHFIYKTINLINGKYYKGKHSCNKLDDGYLGSGTALKFAIQKYGKENFERHIIEFVESAELLSEIEKTFITIDDIISENCYNLTLGGYGGKISLFKENPKYEAIRAKLAKIKLEQRKEISKRTIEQHRKAKDLGYNTCMMGKSQSEKQKESLSKRMKGIPKTKEAIEKQKASLLKTFASEDYTNPNLGKKHSEETKRKISKNHHDVSGERNPNFGRRKFIPESATSKEESKYFRYGEQPLGWILISEWKNTINTRH